MAVADTPLSHWLGSLYGPGTPFRSARQLALAAGTSESVVSKVIERGTASADTLIKIARAAKVDALVPLVLAGWITEPEAAGELSPDEARLIRKYRQMTPQYQQLLHGVAGGFLQPAAPAA